MFWKMLDVKKLLSDPVYRSSRWLYLTAPGDQQQVTTYTEVDRYPLLFEVARVELSSTGSAKILSYGCSTGEEVSSLRRVFPDAELVGADINPAALREAEKLHGGPGIRYLSSRGDSLAALGPFDAVFCMAVLQRFPSVMYSMENLRELYPFEQFAAEVERLHELVAVGGLLILHLTSYRFSDVPISSHYELIPAELDRPWNPVNFEPDGSRNRKGYTDVVFRRLS
jgi:hypothetical protein